MNHDFRRTYVGARCLRCWAWKADPYLPAECSGRKETPLIVGPEPCARCGKRLCDGRVAA